MDTIYFPEKETWQRILQRPSQSFEEIREKVQPILDAVHKDGDASLRQYTERFDGVLLNDLRVSEIEIEQAVQSIDPTLKEAINVAHANIKKFHQSQEECVKMVTTSPGITCWRRSIPIDTVGLYIPGGTSPLFSTVLMLGIPAQLACCGEVVLCSPPDEQGNIHPAILYTSDLVGISQVYKVGGAQAIAAMAYGTRTIPKVNKIFGPGNQFVTAAKQIVSQQKVAIDLPAGPSEVAIIADDTANPEFIASDLLAQAEHAADSQVLFVTTYEDLIESVKQAINRQLHELPRQGIIMAALQNSKLILMRNMTDAYDLINDYAPEHLILMVAESEIASEKIKNAGSVFLGNYSPESVGDYASGTNHTLPTNGYAAAYSGVSLDSFVKKITYQKITKAGLQEIGPFVERMAEAEDLEAHKQAVRIRLNYLWGKNHD